MNEHHIEQALKHSVDEIGGISWKLVSPGTAGVPDRICIMRGRIVFVELKAPGRQPSPIQARRITQLRDHVMTVLVVDSLTGVEEVLDALSAA
ncbi:VRR-NUC domain-containing protein [Trueperella pyogenes]|uniref:VRR-NUC domain-containing protein n=1 Tax=Trueperella pyogenes TaxID=1661 RepID=UPI00325504D2